MRCERIVDICICRNTEAHLNIFAVRAASLYETRSCPVTANNAIAAKAVIVTTSTPSDPDRV